MLHTASLLETARGTLGHPGESCREETTVTSPRVAKINLNVDPLLFGLTGHLMSPEPQFWLPNLFLQDSVKTLRTMKCSEAQRSQCAGPDGR